MQLLIFGTSITWGAWDDEGCWAQRIKAYTDRRTIDLDFEIFTSVYCLGVSGDTSTDLLHRFDTEVKARLGDGEKNVILIEMGINDSLFMRSEKRHSTSPDEYKTNLAQLIEKTKRYESDLIFIGLTPVDDSKVDPLPWKLESSYRLEYVRRYDEILKEVCTDHNIPRIELMDTFMENDFKALLKDGVHPNTEGHRLICEKVTEYLAKRYTI